MGGNSAFTAHFEISNAQLTNMKTLIFISLTILFSILMTSLLTAQPGLPEAPSQAPIDGGLSLLAAAGGAYAIKKLRDKSVE